MVAIRKKLFAVGDDDDAIIDLLKAFIKDQNPKATTLDVLANSVVDIEVDGQQVELSMWNSVGMKDRYNMRSDIYTDTAVILMCFSIDSPDSLKNITEMWKPEATHFCPNVPIILVGNKTDMRDDEFFKRNHEPVREDQGRRISNQINAFSYLECSAKNNMGVRTVFETAVRAALKVKYRNDRRCQLL